VSSSLFQPPVGVSFYQDVGRRSEKGSLPTLAEVLDLEVVRRGRPRVLAAGDRLGTAVRWVHAIELADAGRLLHGGELVLSTGIALPEEAGPLARYVAGLADAGVSGLAVELGRRYTGSLPAALVAAAAERGLPLIAFEREIAFVEITEAVHARIIDAQLDELRAADRMHEVFTALSVAGAGPDEILAQAAALAGRPLILADLSHRVLACAAGGDDPERLLDGFGARSRAAADAWPAGGTQPWRTFHDPASGWLVTSVGARGEDWGRLIMICPGAAAERDTVLIERAATTLALGQLLARRQETLERQAHRTLISEIMAQAHADPAEAALRARALGVPVAGRQLVALVIRVPDEAPAPVPGLGSHARVLAVAESVADACRAARIPALVGSLDDARAAALLSLPPAAGQDTALTDVSRRVMDRLPAGARGPVIGAGSPAASMRDVRRSFAEADQVATAAARDPAGLGGRLFYRLPDLRLRGLLHLLRDDPRLQAFAERELGPLLAHDDAHGGALVAALAAYLEAGGNKAVAARRARLARPTLYERLARVERVLGVSLDSAESRLSLHVALLALQSPARGRAAG
jgi:purine catabolism regulator